MFNMLASMGYGLLANSTGGAGSLTGRDRTVIASGRFGTSSANARSWRAAR